MKEIWKDIPGFENIYQASNKGRIKSLTRIVKGKTEFELKKLNGNLITLCKNKAGYYRVILCKDGKLNYLTVHRIIGLTFIDNPYNKPTINHINGIKTDNRVENLEWNTMSENTIHAYKNNLAKSNGSRHQKIKVYDLNKNFIGEYISQRECARKLNIRQGNISTYFKLNYKKINGYIMIKC